MDNHSALIPLHSKHFTAADHAAYGHVHQAHHSSSHHQPHHGHSSHHQSSHRSNHPSHAQHSSSSHHKSYGGSVSYQPSHSQHHGGHKSSHYGSAHHSASHKSYHGSAPSHKPYNNHFPIHAQNHLGGDGVYRLSSGLTYRDVGYDKKDSARTSVFDYPTLMAQPPPRVLNKDILN